jgi:hypothetical protein
MRRSLVYCVVVLTLSLMLVACGAAAQGPMTWLDRPLDGAKLPLAPVTIQAHASDADGVASFQFFVDDTPLVSTTAEGGRLGTATVEWNPTEPGTYTVGARGVDNQGNAGSEATSVITVGELPQASPTPIAEPAEGEIIFLVDPDVVAPGGCAVLHWQVNPPVDALLNGEPVPPEGDREVCVETSTTYELAVPESGQSRTATLRVETAQEPTPEGAGEVQITFTADRTNIQRGECATLRWSVQGGEAVQLNGGPVPNSGEMEVCPQETTPYRLAAYVAVGPPSPPAAEQELVIVVSEPQLATPSPTYAAPTATGVPPTATPVPAPPTVSPPTPTSPPGCPGPPVISSFTANPSTSTAGQSTTLSWGPVTNGNTSQLVGSVVINPGLGEVGSPGSRAVSPGSTTTYTLVATGCGGTDQRQVTVTVNPAVFSADLAITDLRAEPPSLEVVGDLTNRGPSTISNATVQLYCTWAQTDPIEGTVVDSGDVGPMPILIGNLSQGQTQVFYTDIIVHPGQYDVDFSCTVQVPFNDPNLGNNSYPEQGW